MDLQPIHLAVAYVITPNYMVKKMADKTKKTRSRYPGSIPFAKDDKWVFFGRDADIENLNTKINIEKTIVLYGKSGLGKTSLLNAGVIPKLENKYSIIPLRFGTHNTGDLKHPLDILEQQLYRCCHKESFLNQIEPEDISFWQHIKNLQIANPNRPILLLFDQFEELFTYSQGVNEFAEALAEVIYNRMPKNFQRALRLTESTKRIRLSNKDLEILERPISVKVVMAIRSDHMSLLDRLSHHIPNILKDCYELKHLSQAQAKSAISSPAQKKGEFQSERFSYNPEALEKMLAYLTQNGKKPVESFQLQILCQYVENNIIGDQKDKVVKPIDLGNLESIYHDFYDRTIKNIGNDLEQYKTRVLIEDGLIFEEEKRRIRLFGGQIENTYDIKPELLRRIVDTHIIRREPYGDGYMYELSHDSLVAPILGAKEQRRRQEEKRKEIENKRKEDEKRRLEEKKKRKDKEAALRLQMADQKATYEARSARRMRFFTIVLGGLVIIIFFLMQDLADKLIVSDAEALVEKAEKQIEQSSELSLLLARQAYLLNIRAKGTISSKVHTGLRQVFDRDYFIQKYLHDSVVGPVRFSPNGKKLATGSTKRGVKVVYLWNLENNDAEPQYLEGHTGEIYALAFSQSGKYLASAGEDRTVRLWEFNLKKPEAKPKILKVFTDNMGPVLSVAFNREEDMLAAGCEDKIIRLWDLHNLEAKPKLLEGHTDKVSSVSFRPDGKKLASGSSDYTVRLWNLENIEERPFILQGHTDSILSVVFDPAGKRLASGSYDKMARVWYLDELIIDSVVLKGHKEAVRSVSFSPDGKRLASGSYDETVRIWDLDKPGSESVVLTGHKGYVFSVAFGPGPDGLYLASGSQDRTARLWYLKRTTTFNVLRGHGDHEETVTSLALSPDGKIIASGSHDKTIRLWKLEGPIDDSVKLKGEKNDILSVAFSPDDRWIAAGSTDKNVLLWNRENISAEPIVLVGQHRARVLSVAFSPDGRWLASGSADMTVCLWDLKNLKSNPIVMEVKWGKVYAVAFSPDNRWLAAGSDDMAVRIWDRKTLEKEPIVLRGHEGDVFTLNFSPDSKTLVSGSADKTLRLWNIKKPHKDPVILKGHESTVRSLVFSPDGNALVSGSEDTTVRYWNLINPKEEPIVLKGYSGAVYGVAVSPDGKKIFSGGEGKTIIQWIADPEILAEKICKVVTRNLSVKEWKRFVSRDRDYDTTCSNISIHPSLINDIIDLAKSGDFNGASRLLQKAKERDHNFELSIIEELVQGLRRQGQSMAEAGDVEGAIYNLKKAKKLRSDIDLNPIDDARKLAAEGLVKKGTESAIESDLDGAFALFERAMELNPNSDAQVKEGKQKAAEDLVRKSMNSARDGDIKGANVFFAQAKKLDPSLNLNAEDVHILFAKKLIQKGEDLSRDGKIDDAIESFDKAKSLDSGLNYDSAQKAKMHFANMLVRKGQILAIEGKRDDAIESFIKAKSNDQNLKLEPEIEAQYWETKGKIQNSRDEIEPKRQ